MPTQRRNHRWRFGPEITNSVKPERKRNTIGLILFIVLLIERDVQLKNVHSRLAENPEITTVGILPGRARELFFIARAFHARYLQFGVAQTDMRIEAAARRGDRVRRHRLGIRSNHFPDDTLLLVL